MSERAFGQNSRHRPLSRQNPRWTLLLVMLASAIQPPLSASGATALFDRDGSRKAVDVSGRMHRLGEDPTTKATVVVFLSPECPIACKYIPELKKLADTFSDKHIELFGIIADPDISRTQAAQFEKDFQLSFPLIFDASLEIARLLEPTRTPEAFVFSTLGELMYRGRIDDRFVELGRERAQIGRHDLIEAISAVLEDRVPEIRYSEPVGCKYEALRSAGNFKSMTFCRDIAPIIWGNCSGCHRPGEVAPFSLTSYEDVRKRADQIAEVVGSRYMPPWKAEHGFGRFLEERRLTDREIEMLAAWAEADSPEGDVADLPPLPSFTEGWQLGEPDLIVKFPEAFEVPADGANILRYFALPLPREASGRYVSAFEFRPGNRRVVHHSIAFLDASGLAKSKDAADPHPGYDGSAGPGFPPVGYLGAWVPGALPRALPADLGMPIPPGSMVVVMMHYYPSGKMETDQSMLGIYFNKQPKVRPVTSVPVTNTDLRIPPGESHYRVTASFTLPINATALGVTPHMHNLGREMRAVARLPGQIEPVPLIFIKDWDFNWQGEYRLRQPIRLPKGTTIEVEGFYDNTTANPRNPNPVPKLVTFGQETKNEMCLCGVQIALDDVKDFAPYAAHLMRQFIRVKDGKLVIVPLQ